MFGFTRSPEFTTGMGYVRYVCVVCGVCRFRQFAVLIFRVSSWFQVVMELVKGETLQVAMPNMSVSEKREALGESVRWMFLFVISCPRKHVVICCAMFCSFLFILFAGCHEEGLFQDRWYFSAQLPSSEPPTETAMNGDFRNVMFKLFLG